MGWGGGHYSMYHTVPGGKQVALVLSGQWAGAREALPAGTRKEARSLECAGEGKCQGGLALLCMQLCHV